MIALVTGGYRGIGLGIATALSRERYQVVITGRRDRSETCPILETLSKNGTEAEYVQADVSNAADRQRLVDTVEKRFGRLDVLVNNAGIAPRVRADILEASEESFDEQISINLKGPYFLTQTVAKWMIRQKRADCSYRGCIINISSCSATVASVSRGDYCISKAGIAWPSLVSTFTKFGQESLKPT